MMKPDNCINGGLAMPAMPSEHFDLITSPAGKQPSRIRKIALNGVFCVGMVLIGIPAIPAAILIGVIYLIAQGVNFLMDKIANG